MCYFIDCMKLVNIFILAGTLLFILLLWGIIVFVHFDNLKKELAKRWDELKVFRVKRYDLIPNLLETLKFNGGGSYISLIEEMILMRREAIKDDKNTAERRELESVLDRKINEVFEIAKVLPSLAQDTNFLELKTEFDYFKKEISLKAELYNEEVKRYNNHTKLFFLSPIAFVFRFKAIDVL